MKAHYNYKGTPKVRLLCLGIYCLGKKYFWSTGSGNRICNKCSNKKSNVEEISIPKGRK